MLTPCSQMTENRKYLDFEIVKELWNKYSLKDGSKLKTRIVLKSAWFIQKDNQKKFSVDIHYYTIMMCDPSLQGTKNDTKYTKEQIQKNIEVEDSRYDTISYEANEYILDDTTRILVHTNITKISRTKLYDRNGDRIYVVGLQASITITPAKL